MQYTAIALALATAVAAQGCSPTYPSQFGISVVKTPGEQKRDLQARAQCGGGDKALTIGLKNGNLMDQNGRTGYIASNAQFQFDAPPQPNHLETTGFQVCSNQSLALNGNAVWYQCKSGPFYNLYNKNWAPQCSPVEIMIVPCEGTASKNPAINGGATANPSAEATGGATTAASSAATAPTSQVSQVSDGQPQATSAAPAIATGAAAQYGPQIILAAAGFAGAALL